MMIARRVMMGNHEVLNMLYQYMHNCALHPYPYTHTHISMHARTFVRIHTNTHTHTHTHTNTFTHMCIRITYLQTITFAHIICSHQPIHMHSIH
jgi:hypothetical protein